MGLKQIWNKIIALGVYSKMSRQDRQRVFALNAFAIIISIVYFNYTLVSVLFDVKHIVLMNVIGLVVFTIPLLLNYLKLFVLSRWFLGIAANGYFAFGSIFFGLNSGIHYALLVIGVIPMFLFRSRRWVFLFMIISLGCFIGTAIFCHQVGALQPYGSPLFYLSNLIVIFICFFSFVYFFLGEYKSFETKLLESNSELEAKNRVLGEARAELQDTCRDLVEAESELRDANIDLKNAKNLLEKVVAREREKHQELEFREKELEKLNAELVSSEEEMRQYLEEILQINQNLENTKGHLEQFFAKKHNDKERLQWVNKQLKKTQTQLVQAEKMSSLGQLTAGIAHEINNPINFVSAGVEVMKEILRDISELLQRYKELEEADETEDKNKLIRGIVRFKEEIQYDILEREMSTTLNDIMVGAERTADIVRGLRNFSRTDEQESRYADIHESIDTTFTILKSKLKGGVGVVKMYDRNMPDIECYPGQLNQVFMNLISNAIQAVNGEGEISVTTRVLDREVEIVIADNGHGMDEQTRNKVFEPFFTTKDVGEGTGLGLSISYGIIEKHKGRIEVKSELNVGTEFKVILPIKF